MVRQEGELLREVDLLSSGWRPPEKFVNREAILLDDWRIVEKDGAAIVYGKAVNHPIVSKDGYCQTAPLAWAQMTSDGRHGIVRSQGHWCLRGDKHREGDPIPQRSWMEPGL